MSKVTLHVGGAWDLESSSSDFSIVGLELLEIALWSQQSSPQAQTPVGEMRQTDAGKAEQQAAR